MTDRIASLDKANEDQQLKISEQEKKISALNAELDKLRVESKVTNLGALARLADGKVDIGLKRQKADVKCSIGGMAAFLNSDEKKYTQSEFFFYDDRAWSVEVGKQRFEDKTYLSVCLRATDFANPSANWSIKAACKITLLNSKPLSNLSFGSKKFGHLEFSKQRPLWGWDNFITINELRSGGFLSSSFIKNDEIKLKVYLRVEKSC